MPTSGIRTWRISSVAYARRLSDEHGAVGLPRRWCSSSSLCSVTEEAPLRPVGEAVGRRRRAPTGPGAGVGARGRARPSARRPRAPGASTAVSCTAAAVLRGSRLRHPQWTAAPRQAAVSLEAYRVRISSGRGTRPLRAGSVTRSCGHGGRGPATQTASIAVVTPIWASHHRPSAWWPDTGQATENTRETMPATPAEARPPGAGPPPPGRCRPVPRGTPGAGATTSGTGACGSAGTGSSAAPAMKVSGQPMPSARAQPTRRRSPAASTGACGASGWPAPRRAGHR